MRHLLLVGVSVLQTRDNKANLGFAERDVPIILHKQQVARSLTMLKMSENDSMSDHFQRLQTIIEKLAAIQCKIDEDEKIVLLLNSLPESYASLASVLACTLGTTSIQAVKSLLLQEELHKHWN